MAREPLRLASTAASTTPRAVHAIVRTQLLAIFIGSNSERENPMSDAPQPQAGRLRFELRDFNDGARH